MWIHSTRNSRRASNFSLRTSVAVLAAAVMLTSCAPVYGQWGNSRPRNGSYGGYRVERQVFDQGYQDGYRQGRDDARDGDRFDPRGQREYRNADNGRYRIERRRGGSIDRASSRATKRAIATRAAGGTSAGGS